MKRIFKWWREKNCQHKFDYLRDMTSRDAEGKISCKCCVCGVVFKAEYGLALPGELIQKPDSLQAMYEKAAIKGDVV